MTAIQIHPTKSLKQYLLLLWQQCGLALQNLRVQLVKYLKSAKQQKPQRGKGGGKFFLALSPEIIYHLAKLNCTFKANFSIPEVLLQNEWSWLQRAEVTDTWEESIRTFHHGIYLPSFTDQYPPWWREWSAPWISSSDSQNSNILPALHTHKRVKHKRSSFKLPD